MDFQTIAQTPLVDDEQMQMLVETGEDAAADLIEELLDLFVEESEPKLKQLEAALGSNDRPGVARDAHAIAGSSANLGALRLSRVARALEHAAPTAANAELSELLAYLRGCYRESLEVFRGQVERLRSA